MRKLLILMMLLFSSVVWSQVKFTYNDGKKEVYVVGDKVQITIEIQVPPETCADGMQKVKIFGSGLQISTLSNWIEIRKGLWSKKIECMIQPNKKTFSQLTVFNRSDKQDLVVQEKFNRKD